MSLHSSSLLWASYCLCLSFDLLTFWPRLLGQRRLPSPTPRENPRVLHTGHRCVCISHRSLQIDWFASQDAPPGAQYGQTGSGSFWEGGGVVWCQAAAAPNGLLVSCCMVSVFVFSSSLQIDKWTNIVRTWSLCKHPLLRLHLFQSEIKFVTPTPGGAFCKYFTFTVHRLSCKLSTHTEFKKPACI